MKDKIVDILNKYKWHEDFNTHIIAEDILALFESDTPNMYYSYGRMKQLSKYQIAREVLGEYYDDKGTELLPLIGNFSGWLTDREQE